MSKLAWRHEERSRRTGLARSTGHAHLSRLAGSTGPRLIRPLGAAPENRHHDQPAIGELVIANDGVSVIRRLARAPETSEDGIGGDGTVQNLASRFELFAFLRKDRHPRIDDLEDVIQADGEAVIGRVSQDSSALRAFEPNAEPVETFDQRRPRPSSLRPLFNGVRTRRACHHGRDYGRRRILCACFYCGEQYDYG